MYESRLGLLVIVLSLGVFSPQIFICCFFLYCSSFSLFHPPPRKGKMVMAIEMEGIVVRTFNKKEQKWNAYKMPAVEREMELGRVKLPFALF